MTGRGTGVTPLSPRLTQLHAELDHNGASALARFWREVAERGTPLVERAADGTDGGRAVPRGTSESSADEEPLGREA